MNLLLNASNLRQGGAKTVALQLLDAVAPLRGEDKLFVIAPQKAGYESLTRHPNIALLPVPDRFQRSLLSKLRHNYYVFPKWCDRLQIDKVVSLGNIAFPAKGRPHMAYIQLPQLVYHESPAWKTMAVAAFLRNSLIDQYVALHLRHASSFAVQTDMMRSRLIDRFKLEDALVHVIPNAPLEPEASWEPAPLPQPLSPLKLLLLSRYYPHKNFECLPELAKILQEQNVPVEITLTISKEEDAGAAKVLDALRGFSFIRNLGPVPVREVGSLVEAHHGVFLPSLMESFSGAYAEALLHRRLIFTSHFDFASGLLGDAAFYFDPLRPEHIASVIEAAIVNPEIIAEKLAAIDTAAGNAPRIADAAASFSRIINSFS